MIQAERDEVVPPAHGRLLFERGRRAARLHVIAGADHRLTDPAPPPGGARARAARWLLVIFLLAPSIERTAP